MDEQWSFVGNKKQQRWLFYAWEPRFKKIIAHAFGSRSKETLKKLLERLARFRVSFYCTDDWQLYTSCLLSFTTPIRNKPIRKKCLKFG